MTMTRRTIGGGGADGQTGAAADWELHSPLLTVFDLIDQSENDGPQDG
jgi:hypothetical protein